MAEKINLIIVGFQKAGTTSVKKYLSRHHDILSHPQQEMTYFSIAEEFAKDFSVVKRHYFGKSNFDEYKYVLIKHSTLIRHNDNVKRLAQYNPYAKIIVCLRDPTERAFSSYLMERASGSTKVSFEEMVIQSFNNHEKGRHDWRYNIFIKLGEYINYVRQLKKYYPVKQLYFIKTEELNIDPEIVLRDLYNWLDLRDSKEQFGYLKHHNEFKVQRSQYLGSIIKFLLSEKSFIKKMIRNILPTKSVLVLGAKLRGMNKVKAQKPTMSQSSRIKLKNHYRQFNDAFNELMNKNYY